MKYRVGVDVGGTFTDLVCIDEEGKLKVAKVSSTPDDPSIGIENAIVRSGIDLSSVTFFSHGATVAANTVIEKKGAKTAIITTKGFRDIFEIRKAQRVTLNPLDMYNLQMDLPHGYVGGLDPIVHRPLRFEVTERVNYQGDVVKELDEDEVRYIAKEIRAKGVKAVAVCYLFSFVNPEHEQRTAKLLRKLLPGVCISVSSEILPIIREYERLSTTTMNAYIMPIMQSYLLNLRNKLNARGFNREFYIMQSSGGIMSSELAGLRPVYTIDSGPAGGVTASAQLGTMIGYSDVIAIDMGGTTTKVCVIHQGKAEVTNEFWVDGNYFIGAPVMDMVEIGAGGGSIAWLDKLGLLHVGPKSAAANPGPVCYQKGGQEPTVTDADVVLGYLNPDFFCGGEIKLDAEAAKKAIKEKIADPLGKDVAQAANDICNVVNSNMIDATRVITIRRGEDPSEYVAVVGGGAGPVHVCRIAAGLKIPLAVIPKTSSFFCCAGMLASDIKHDFAQAYACRTRSIDLKKLNELYREMEREGNSTLAEEVVPESDRYFIRSIDMRYVGQIREVEVQVPNGVLTEKDLPAIEEGFHERHEKLYSHRVMENPTEIVDLRVIAGGRTMKLQFPEQRRNSKDPSKAFKMERDVFWEEYNGFVKTPIYDGDKLRYGNFIPGPAVIEERTTTVVIPPKYEVNVNRHGNYIMRIPV